MSRAIKPDQSGGNLTLPMSTRTWQYCRGLYKGTYTRLFLIITISIGQSFLYLPILLLIRYTFDDVIPSGNSNLLVLVGAGIIFLYLVSGGVTLYTRYILLKTNKLIIKSLRNDMLKKLYTLSRTFYSQADRSRLHTNIVQDTERVDVMANALVAQLIPAILISIIISAVLIYLNWLLFIVMMGVLSLLFVAGTSIGKMVKKQTHSFHRSFEKFSKGVLFVLQMMDLTRIQSAERFEIDRQIKNLEELRSTSGKMAWLRIAYSLIQNTIVATSGILVLIVGGAAVATGYMTLGELLAFYAAIALLRTHLGTISYCVPQIIEGNESLITLVNLLEINDSRPYSGTKQTVFSGKITLEGVCFKYKDHPVLHDINLTIHPNTRVAIIGPNGSGKTTIANLILGLYRPQKGQLYADNHPFSELDIVNLRRYIGVVTQTPIIFPGTIWENITYGSPNVNRQQVIQAAELAVADEFIQQLPHGYGTLVGENGVLLSGGQCQRIAIARALLRQPKLLLLDELTNHLDIHAAHQLMNNLKTLDSFPATVIISHDINVSREVEYIYVLREGRIEVSGDSETLSLQWDAVLRSLLNE